MKHIEEKDGKIFIDGIEYVPKETKEELPKCYGDIIDKYNMSGHEGWIVTAFGNLNSRNIGLETEGVFFNFDFAKAMLKLKNLLEIRDEYNEDWKPDFSIASDRWNIGISINTIDVLQFSWSPYSEFIFKTKELAEQFLENHKKDIEFVFKHIYMWNI